MIAYRFHHSIFGALAVMTFLASPVIQASELHDAVIAGDAARVKAVLAGGANVDEPDLNGPALHLAVALGSEDVAKGLIDAGANLESIGEPADSHPLHVAARADQAKIAALLLDRGAKVDAFDGEGRTPLMVAVVYARIGVAKALLSHGADVMARDSIYGDTVLHYAVGNDEEIVKEIVSLLLSSGADVNAKSTTGGQTPLFYAAIHGKLDMVKLLAASGADLSVVDKKGDTALERANDAAKELLRSLGAKK